MLRYVVLLHDHPFPHWDLMLEYAGGLRTWRLLEIPEPEKAIAAEPLSDHRREYLDYEGPVSGGRGEVRRWDAGTYAIVQEDAGSLEADFRGARLRGRASLRRNVGGRNWTFYFRAD